MDDQPPKHHRRRRRRPAPATLHDFVQPNRATEKLPSQSGRFKQITQRVALLDTVKPARYTSQTKRRSRMKTAILRSRESTKPSEEADVTTRSGLSLPSMRFCVRNLVQKDELEDPDELKDLMEDLTAEFEAFDGFTAVQIVNEDNKELELHGNNLSKPGDVIVAYNSSEKAELAFAAYQGKRYGGVELECAWVHDANTVANMANQNEFLVDDVHEIRLKQTCDSTAGQVATSHMMDEVPSQLLASLLQRLAALQERAHQQNPLHDTRSKRLVLGLNEVQRNVTSKKLRLLFVANDIESCDSLESKMAEIMESAWKSEIPVIQSLSRRQLGRYLSKSVRVSCVGVCSIDGANDTYQQILSHLHKVLT